MVEREIVFELPIDAERVREFAIAVGENNPIFFDERAAFEHGLPGPVAPPSFTVTQTLQVPRYEREATLGAGLDDARVLHGEQEFVYRRLPVVGETLTGRMRISKDHTKEGKRGGAMRFVTYETRFVDAAGDDVLTAYYTLIQTERDPAP